MNRTVVRYFIAVCKEKSFTRAAKQLGVAQPSLSIAIMRLEKKIGGRLFERGSRGSQLTELGQILRPYFRTIDRTMREIESTSARHAQNKIQPIRTAKFDLLGHQPQQPSDRI